MEASIAGVIGMALNRRTVEESTESKLLDEIEAVKKSLEMVTTRFDYQNDPDLVEECIYEMQALTARYRYLTREARRQGLTKSTLLSLKRVT